MHDVPLSDLRLSVRALRRKRAHHERPGRPHGRVLARRGLRAHLPHRGATLLRRRVPYHQFLDLVVFPATVNAQLTAFTERVTNDVQASADLRSLARLPSREVEEAQGYLTPLNGAIDHTNIHFAYPSTPPTSILKGVSLSIAPVNASYNIYIYSWRLGLGKKYARCALPTAGEVRIGSVKVEVSK